MYAEETILSFYLLLTHVYKTYDNNEFGEIFSTRNSSAKKIIDSMNIKQRRINFHHSIRILIKKANNLIYSTLHYIDLNTIFKGYY
jgi:hypothetical protein